MASPRGLLDATSGNLIGHRCTSLWSVCTTTSLWSVCTTTSLWSGAGLPIVVWSPGTSASHPQPCLLLLWCVSLWRGRDCLITRVDQWRTLIPIICRFERAHHLLRWTRSEVDALKITLITPHNLGFTTAVMHLSRPAASKITLDFQVTAKKMSH